MELTLLYMTGIILSGILIGGIKFKVRHVCAYNSTTKLDVSEKTYGLSFFERDKS